MSLGARCCGESTSAHETTAASAERRQLTVMFCDLVGSTVDLIFQFHSVAVFKELR
jgi:hypothetical protein